MTERIDKRKKHGLNRTKIHRTWKRIRSRCFNKNDGGYHKYGGRGITVCERWLDFNNFVSDMGIPESDQSIERLNNNAHYSPDNCIWANSKTQARNRRNSVFIEIDGLSKTIAEWGDISGVSRSLISGRIKNGWSPTEAIFTPSQRAIRGA